MVEVSLPVNLILSSETYGENSVRRPKAGKVLTDLRPDRQPFAATQCYNENRNQTMMSDTQLDEKWGQVIPLLLVLETLCALGKWSERHAAYSITVTEFP
jgi:hypothetical protein